MTHARGGRRAPKTGVVTEFDEPRGLGVVRQRRRQLSLPLHRPRRRDQGRGRGHARRVLCGRRARRALRGAGRDRPRVTRRSGSAHEGPGPPSRSPAAGLADLHEGQSDLGQGLASGARRLPASPPGLRPARPWRRRRGVPGRAREGVATSGWRPARTGRRRGWPRRRRPGCSAVDGAARRAARPARPVPRARDPRALRARRRPGPFRARLGRVFSRRRSARGARGVGGGRVLVGGLDAMLAFRCPEAAHAW